MAADEDVRLIAHQERVGVAVVLSRVAADVRHQNLHPFACPETVDRIVVAEVVVVAVAADTDERLESGYLGGSLKASAEVPGMPDFIHRRQKFPERGIENPVSVRYESYKHDFIFSITRILPPHILFHVLDNVIPNIPEAALHVRVAEPAICLNVGTHLITILLMRL